MSFFLYLVRHGAVLNLDGRRYIGQFEAPLNERGIEQAWALRNWMDPVVFSAAYCSDLTRSQRTARIVIGQRDIPLTTCPELREISLGDWEGVSFREIAQRNPEAYAARGRDLEHWRPSQGESFGDCRDRVLPAMHRLLEAATGNVLMVGHAGVNRVILSSLLGIPIQNIMSIGQDYGCVNLIEFRDSDVRLRLLNYSPEQSRPVPQVVPVKPVRRRAR